MRAEEANNEQIERYSGLFCHVQPAFTWSSYKYDNTCNDNCNDVMYTFFRSIHQLLSKYMIIIRQSNIVRPGMTRVFENEIALCIIRIADL